MHNAPSPPPPIIQKKIEYNFYLLKLYNYLVYNKLYFTFLLSFLSIHFVGLYEYWVDYAGKANLYKSITHSPLLMMEMRQLLMKYHVYLSRGGRRYTTPKSPS